MTATTQHATIPAMFAARVAADSDGVALHIPDGTGFRKVSWNELAHDVRRTAAALVELGIAPGDRVLLASPNRYEWIVVDLGIQLAQGVHVPAHASLSGPQIAYQIAHSQAKVAVVSGPDQAAKLVEAAADLPGGLKLVTFDDCDGWTGPSPILRLADLIRDASGDLAAAVEGRAVASVTPDDLATILYTSGTTGEPKGVMLSQRNLASNTYATLQAFEVSSHDLRLTWLPFSHIFARTCDFYCWIAAGAELALAEAPDKVLANCAALKPTLLNGVPYFWEKVQRVLVERGEADRPGALAAMFGGRLRMCCSGGAALPDHVARFYQERGVLLTQGYGLTESSPVITAGTPQANRIGTVGPAIPGVEVRISDEGEILTRGPHVMQGYWRDPQATASTIHDGWLLTGDLGELDADGYLKITGRKKEIIVTAGGKNVAPTLLESLLTADPLILQAIVIGDARNYLTALIVPNPEALKGEIVQRGIPVTSPAEALTHPAVLAMYADRVRERLSGLSDFEQVQRFTLLDRGFTPDRGEMTLTLKLRRKQIQANFADQIEAMYACRVEDESQGSSG